MVDCDTMLVEDDVGVRAKLNGGRKFVLEAIEKKIQEEHALPRSPAHISLSIGKHDCSRTDSRMAEHNRS